MTARTPRRPANLTAVALPQLPPAEEVAERIGWPFPAWAQQCHAVSLAIVKAGILPAGSRVARGTAHGVMGQHSWIVVGPGDGTLADCYADDAAIVDPTLWSYRDDVEGIWVGRAGSGFDHVPHGKGPHIMDWGRPEYPTGEPIPLAPEAFAKLSATAKSWVRDMFGPLDRRGWMQLASMTVVGWPAAEIIRAMHDTPELAICVPIDRLGMLTDVDPEGLYGTTPGERVQVGD